MRVGLLGAGRIGRFHARLLSEHPDVETLLIADADAPRAAAVADEIGGPVRAADLAEILNSDAVDAVAIAAATSAHAELVNAALDAGLPTFCEKPLALTLEETQDIVERVEASGAILQVGFQRRMDAGYREARRLIESGQLGTVYSMRMAAHDPEPPHESYIPQSGSIFRDLHIHDFDILRWLAGAEVAEVYARGSVRKFDMFARYGDVDTSAALMTMENGVLVVLTGARQDPLGYDIRMEVFGSGDSISIGLNQHTPIRSVEPGVTWPEGPGYANFMVRFEPAYRAELARFLDVARGRAENPCTARDALQAFRIALAAERSFAEGRPVQLSEIGASVLAASSLT